MDDARDLGATGLEVDDEKHEIANQSTGGEHFHSEEIRCSYSSPWAFTKVLQEVRFVRRAIFLTCTGRG